MAAGSDRPAAAFCGLWEQQHTDEWLIVQYVRIVVKPIEDAHITTSNASRTAVCKMRAFTVLVLTKYLTKKFPHAQRKCCRTTFKTPLPVTCDQPQDSFCRQKFGCELAFPLESARIGQTKS